MTVDDALPTQVEPEKFGPGSDIYKSHPDQVIGTINDTHVLALNIYPVFRPQYLLLNIDSYRSQNEPLDLQDVEASWTFLRSVQSPHYVMYNCTKEAGCSRYHKHTQIVRKPEVAESDPTGFRFFPDVKNREIRVPYVYFIHHFDCAGQGQSIDGKAVFSIYLDLLRQCRKALDIAEADSTAVCPHNVLLVKEWIIVIPRRRGDFKGVSANSAGMMGMPTISNEELFKIWTTVGPAKVLSELGLPNSSA
jgi:ATP adenylyltransferase/5',5'''-P-1,P-4-tetraphosphate phosphorylase II